MPGALTRFPPLLLHSSAVCCSSLEEPKALMKMGLSMILIGHVNFLLGALVHGVVLRHINLHKQARAMEYAISNVVALTSGLVVSVWWHTRCVHIQVENLFGFLNQSTLNNQYWKSDNCILDFGWGAPVISPAVDMDHLSFTLADNQRRKVTGLCGMHWIFLIFWVLNNKPQPGFSFFVSLWKHFRCAVWIYSTFVYLHVF